MKRAAVTAALLGTGYLVGRTQPVEKIRDHLHRRIIWDAHGGAIPDRGPKWLKHAVGWTWLGAYALAFPDQGWKLLKSKRQPARPVAEESIGINPEFLAPTIYMDFNEIEGNQAHSLSRLFIGEPRVGMKVRAVDADGQSCPGVITEVGESELSIELDLDRFKSVSPNTLFDTPGSDDVRDGR